MKTLILLFILSIGIFSCIQDKNLMSCEKKTVIYKEKIDSSGIQALEKLKKAYKTKSKSKLLDFFSDWSQEIQPITKQELEKLNDTLINTHKSFEAFYKPTQIDKLGGSEWGNDIYKNVDFLILQDFIQIHFAEKVYYTKQEIDDYITDYINKNVKNKANKERLLKRDENGNLPRYTLRVYSSTFNNPKRLSTHSKLLQNFRPQINIENKTPIYLSKKYTQVLNAFLDNKHISLGQGNIMSPAKAKGKSDKRKKFLEHYVKIWHGHWGGYWQLYSYPSVSSITFDQDMKYALIKFRMVYEGGEAILRNDNGKWVLISARKTWIE